MEYERKFIINKYENINIEYAIAFNIQQIYLHVGERKEVRLRKEDGSLNLDIKFGNGLAREEISIYIDSEKPNLTSFAYLWDSGKFKKVEKTRFLLDKTDDYTITIDDFIYPEVDFQLYEVEFNTPETIEDFKLLYPHDYEVTGMKKYLNKNIARL